MIAFYEQRLVQCEVAAPFAGSGVVWFCNSHWGLNLVCILVYLITWQGLRAHSDSTSTKRVVRTLCFIVTVDVSGWILTPGLFLLSMQQLFVSAYFSLIFTNVALLVKIFIYYYTSSEYRTAIRAFLV
ncbi:hypothetical protein PMAYCL1PPCAC_19535, partial [Pristionchus mayeri]